jgi:hypothetical protein
VSDKVCDKATKECRDNRLKKTSDYYIELCKKKGIPLVYENGEKKGQKKTLEALKRCVKQRPRPVSDRPKAKSAIARVDLPVACRSSGDCPGQEVCEKKVCRPNKKDKPVDYYIDLCKKKGIPVHFEVGKDKGKLKPIEALKRCVKQKARPKKASAKAKSI